MIALSTVEAEYIAAANNNTQTLWLHHMLGVIQHKHSDPTKTYYNNKPVIELSKNPDHHGLAST